jgi:hypothetical protein
VTQHFRSNRGLFLAGCTVIAVLGCSSSGSVAGGGPGDDTSGGNGSGASSGVGNSSSTGGSAAGTAGNSSSTGGSAAGTAGNSSSTGGNSSSGASGVAGSGTAGGSSGVAGNAGSGTAGSGTAGSGTAGGTGAGGSAAGSAGSGAAGVAGSAGASGGAAGSGGVAGSGGQAGGGSGAGGTAGSGSSALIKNDVFWKDTQGNPIYSQGGGVLTVGNTYYWYGVNYTGAASYLANPTNQNSNTGFVAITTYSSTDLANWKFEGNALTYASMASKLTMTTSTWIGRVGATYNATTKKYVIVGQYLGTPDTQQFFATSDTPNGAFTVQGTQAVLTNVTNNNCGDQSIFTDDDGQGYILCSSLNGRSNIYIIPLRPADFLQAQPASKIYGGAGREGNAMFKYGGRYYVCSSDLHGWNASHTYCISATNITGPYAAETVMGNTDRDFSHVTQTGLFITVKGSSQDLVIFGGDRWSDFAGNGIGYNEWMPLTFNGTAPVMQSLSVWSINASAGTWAVGPGNNYVLNPSFEADRVATNPPAGWTTTAGTDVTTTHTGNFAWQLSGASSVDQQVTLPNASYTLSVWIRGTGSGTLFAKGCGGADKSIALNGGAGWTQLSLTGIAASSGQCDVGASSTTGTVTLDDFALTAN